MEPPRDLRVGWDKMISREMQLEMWKIENQGVRKSLDELAQRYSAPGNEWRRHLPAMPLSLDRSSQTDASELQPVAEMDDERRHLRKELEKLRRESEDALRRQKLFYEDQLSKVGPELRAQAQKQMQALELEMEERLRAVRAACRVQLRNELARATEQLRRDAGRATLAEAEVQVDAVGDEEEQNAPQQLSSPSAGQPLPAESREWWTQEREQLLHEAACRLQRQTSTLRRMAARIDQLEDQLAVARIKEESTNLEARRRGGAVLTSAEAELRLEAVRRHAQRLESALEARRKEAEEAHSEASELRRQLALVQGCAALRGHWLGTSVGPPGSLSNREEAAAEEEQLHGREATPHRLTSWSRVAAKEAPPTQERGERTPRVRSPPPRSAGTRSTDSLEGELMGADDRRRRLQEGAWADDAARRSPSPRQGAGEEGFYLQNSQNQEVWTHINQKDMTTEANANEGVTHSIRTTGDTDSVHRTQGSPLTDDDDDVITENPTNTDTVGNSPGTFSESKSQSWHSAYRNKDATGRFRRIDTLRSPRSQVVHHVVNIEPDFSADFRRRVPIRRSRFGGGLERMRGEEMGYPVKYAVPSQQISSFTYSAGTGNQVWPSSYTERNLVSAEVTQGAAGWETTDVKGSVFNEMRDSNVRHAPRRPHSAGARARMTRPHAVKTETWSKPSDASKLSSDSSSAESPDREATGASYYDGMVQRMGGDVEPTGDQRPEGEPAPSWSFSPVHGGEEGQAVRKTGWRRLRPGARGHLSEHSASELQEIDRRRQQRQMQHLEAMATRE